MQAKGMDGETLELIQRGQAGDSEAFAALFHKHKNLVYKTAFLMLGNAAEAEDLLQEVFLEVYRSLRSYQPSRGAFTTWLYRITVNDCLNHKRTRRWTSVPLDDVVAVPQAHGLHDERLEMSDEVWKAISRLTPKLRIVVILRYYWDLSYAELTQVLNVPLGTVKSRLNQALQIVKRDLEANAARGVLGDLPPDLLTKRG
jgi:RNA polymerase sigma-70 factor (ECF subfamily)